MSGLRALARRLRHSPLLQSRDRLWNLVRGPYQRLLGIRGKGVKVAVGGSAVVRMPADLSGGSWETYEPEAIGAVRDWVRRHPGGLFLDVGCSIGVYSAVALFAERSVKVVALDADLASLAVAQRMCRYAGGSRLQLVHGLVGDASSKVVPLAIIADATRDSLKQAGLAGDLGSTRYVCLGSPGSAGVASRRLADLFPADSHRQGPCLVKIDVEGAELLVLRGAASFLARERPCLLVSVHPQELESVGQSVEEVRNFLTALGYGIRCLAVDHEEHWWCECRTGAVPGDVESDSGMAGGVHVGRGLI